MLVLSLLRGKGPLTSSITTEFPRMTLFKSVSSGFRIAYCIFTHYHANPNLFAARLFLHCVIQDDIEKRLLRELISKSQSREGSPLYGILRVYVRRSLAAPQSLCGCHLAV